jgi:hypothetical protein
VTKLLPAWSGVRILVGATVFPRNIRPVLKPILPPIQWVSDAITPRQRQGNWLQHAVEHSVCLAVRLRINGAIPLLPPQVASFHGSGRFIVKCVRSLIPKDSGVLLKFYDFIYPSSKSMLSKLTQSNLDFTSLREVI